MSDTESEHASESHAGETEHGGEHGGGEHHHSLAQRVMHGAHPIVSTLSNIHTGIHGGIANSAEHQAAHHLEHQRAAWVADQTRMSRSMEPRPTALQPPRTPQTLRTEWDDSLLSRPAPATSATPATPRTPASGDMSEYVDSLRSHGAVAEPVSPPRLTPPNLEPVPVPFPNAQVPPVRTPASGDMASYVDNLRAHGAIAEPPALVPPPSLPNVRAPAPQTPLTLRTDWDNSLLRPPELVTPTGPDMAEYVDNLRAHGAIPTPSTPAIPPVDPDVVQIRPAPPSTLATPHGPDMAEYVDNLTANGGIRPPAPSAVVPGPLTPPNLQPVPTGVSPAAPTPNAEPASLPSIASDLHPDTAATRLLSRVETGMHIAAPVLSTAELVLGVNQVMNGVDSGNGSDVAQGFLGAGSGGAGLLSTVGLGGNAAPLFGAAAAGYNTMRQVNDASGETFEFYGAMTSRQRRGVSADPDHRDPGRQRVGDNRSISDRFTDAHYDPHRNPNATRRALAIAPHLPRYMGGDLPGLTGHDDAIADAFSRVGLGPRPGETGTATVSVVPDERSAAANAATMRALGVAPTPGTTTPPVNPLLGALRQAQATHQTEPTVTVLPDRASAARDAAALRALGLGPNGQPLPAAPAAPDPHAHTTADGAPYSM